jgi:hypothetical protein
VVSAVEEVDQRIGWDFDCVFLLVVLVWIAGTNTNTIRFIDKWASSKNEEKCCERTSVLNA